jgi:hypothetical protein
LRLARGLLNTSDDCVFATHHAEALRRKRAASLGDNSRAISRKLRGVPTGEFFRFEANEHFPRSAKVIIFVVNFPKRVSHTH